MGKVTLTDEAGAPVTPEDGLVLYALGAKLYWKTEGGAVHEVVSDQNLPFSADITAAMLAADAVTTAKIADANVTTAKLASEITDLLGGSAVNLVWDEINLHIEDKGAWDGRSWFEDSASLTLVSDGSNPYGGKTLRSTVSGKGKGIYLADVGLRPGDVISAGMMCKAASGTWACRLVFRTTGPGASAVSTVNGSSHTFTGDTVALVVNNVTIPATAGWVTIVPYSASPTSIDMYALWAHRGTVAATTPVPSPYTATYLRLKEWESSRQRLMIRNVDAVTFHVYQALPDGQTWIRWIFTKISTNSWTYYGADLCSDNAGSGAYNVIIFDIGYAINYTPNGASNQSCGNHHLYESFSSVAFYDAAGTVVDPTATGAAFQVQKLRIEQKGTLLHPDTGATAHANVSRFTEFTVDGPYEHIRLAWLTANNGLGYFNTGQILATSASRAWIHNHGAAPFVVGDATLTVTGATRAYSWYHSRKFTFEVNCPTAEAVQLRTTTLKVYPRTVDADVIRNAGDVDHGEWYWRVIYDKQFEKRI